MLEERCLLANVAWTGSGGDNLWSDQANWSSGQVPGSGDGVAIDLPGSFTILYDATAGASTIDTLSGSDALSVTGGSLTVTSSASISGPLAVPGGSLTLGSNSAISGGLSVSQGRRRNRRRLERRNPPRDDARVRPLR
jgi:hypothetical protein